MTSSLLTLVALSTAAPPEDERFFENRVRPVLAEKCFECHGPKKQQAGLRLDSRAAVLAGGDSGPAAVAGKRTESGRLKPVRHDGELKMPPKGKLTDAEIADLEKWVSRGLAWPAEKIAAGGPAKELWSLRPVTNPPIPVNREA